MMLFASGGLGYFAGRAIRKRVPPESFTMSGGIAFAILAVVIVANPTALGWWLRIFPGYMESLYLGNAAILLAVALASPHLFYAFRNVRFDSFLGELSYPMYLSHLLVGGILLRLHLPAWLNLWQLVLCGGDSGGRHSPGEVHRHSCGPNGAVASEPASRNIYGRPRAQRNA
jgi:peptidoglycan/LPS O-acetylase OafA/YrhL